MSIVPGDPAWRDAGLEPVDPEPPLRLGDDVPGDAVDDPEEYAPGAPRPDLDAAADEADVVEQAAEVPLDDPEGPAL